VTPSPERKRKISPGCKIFAYSESTSMNAVVTELYVDVLLSYATAFTWVGELTLIGVENGKDVFVGCVPSSVKKIAPAGAVMLTDCVDEYVPVPGDTVGGVSAYAGSIVHNDAARIQR